MIDRPNTPSHQRLGEDWITGQALNVDGGAAFY